MTFPNAESPPPMSTEDRARSVGSFEHDFKTAGYVLCWENTHEMEVWLQKEEDKNTIEFIKKDFMCPSSKEIGKLWSTKQIYICAHGHSSGKSKYKKKHDWDRAVPVKKMGCPCRLTVKTYPYTRKLLGKYLNEHSHEMGNINTHFVRLHKETRDEIERLLRLGVEPRKVVCNLRYFSMAGTLTVYF